MQYYKKNNAKIKLKKKYMTWESSCFLFFVFCFYNETWKANFKRTSHRKQSNERKRHCIENDLHRANGVLWTELFSLFI